MSKAVGIIPARWSSTRFPGKPLHRIAGKPLLQHVWEGCRRAKSLDSVIIATDDMRIADASFQWGAEVALTSRRHQSGTDRIAEVAAKARQFEFIINIQGDEPLIEPQLIDRLVAKLRSDRSIKMVTAAHPFADPTEATSPHQVKVVVDRQGRALYFSRAPIPYSRTGGLNVASASSRWGASAARTIGRRPMPHADRRTLFLRHQGIYGFRREALLQFVRWKPTPLERAESLEQLRALENGVTVFVLITRHGSPGVDTLAEAKRLEKNLIRAGVTRGRSGVTNKKRRRR
jgi:3-deoxy-manno-octulosonate cytidylyltransferase (CMP-KDO synthetase)